jgi:hypothetical protein
MSILKLCKIISHVENMRFPYWRLQQVMFKSTEVKVLKVKWRYSATVLSKLQEKFQTFLVGRGFRPYTWVKLKCSL